MNNNFYLFFLFNLDLVRISNSILNDRMTQPLRLNVHITRSREKPPAINLKLLAKQFFCRCIPCIRKNPKDEKLLLTPHVRTSSSNDYDAD
jgi:hypothetical protein